MTRDEKAKRQAVIDACRRMNALGINRGASGNISVRHRDGQLGDPPLLSKDEIERVRLKMVDYGHANA